MNARQATLGGHDIFARKKYVWKISKMPEFYMIRARKIIEIPEFLWHLPEKLTIFPNFTWLCPKNATIIARKILFPRFFLGGGHVPRAPLATPSSPTPMNEGRMWDWTLICCLGGPRRYPRYAGRGNYFGFNAMAATLVLILFVGLWAPMYVIGSGIP